MLSFIIFETLLWGLFLLAIVDASKRWSGKQIATFFVPLFIYGWLLEASAIGIFQRYEYGPHFILTLFDAPLCIAAGWASITYSGLCIGRQMSDKPLKIAIFTALWGLSIDFSMDGLAVLLGYWTWFAPEGVVLPYFNVPVSNFIGWFIILSFYTYFHLRWENHSIRKKLLGFDAILPALPALLISITIMIESEYERVFISFPWWLMLIVVVFPVMFLLALWLQRNSQLNASEVRVPLMISHGFHAFFIIVALVIGFESGDWRYLIAAFVAVVPLFFISRNKMVIAVN